tara:strand:+ start:548 stop:1168 length:621 start_codon:yes stop_codon:yes gene_type:complete
MTDFIYRKENALSFDFCRSLIELFEIDKERQHRGVIRKKGEIQSADDQKISTDITFIPNDLQDKRWGKPLHRIINTVEEARQNWITQYYMGLDNVDPFEINFTFNMQRFLPGEGYHAFHCERASWETRDRVGVWMIYLNDVHDRGWTEFFYQQHYEIPKAGKIVCWPSDFTHTHRGIVSPTETKYILTGWFTLIDPKTIEEKNEKS